MLSSLTRLMTRKLVLCNVRVTRVGNEFCAAVQLNWDKNAGEVCLVL